MSWSNWGHTLRFSIESSERKTLKLLTKRRNAQTRLFQHVPLAPWNVSDCFYLRRYKAFSIRFYHATNDPIKNNYSTINIIPSFIVRELLLWPSCQLSFFSKVMTKLAKCLQLIESTYSINTPRIITPASIYALLRLKPIYSHLNKFLNEKIFKLNRNF